MSTHIPLDEGSHTKDCLEYCDDELRAMDDCAFSPKLFLRPSYLHTPRHFRPEAKQEACVYKLEPAHSASVPDMMALELPEPIRPITFTLGGESCAEAQQPPTLVDFTSWAGFLSESQPQAESMELSSLEPPTRAEAQSCSLDEYAEPQTAQDVEAEAAASLAQSAHESLLKDEKEEEEEEENKSYEEGDVYQEGSRGSKFTREEDETLRQLVACYGRNWALIANLISGKNRKQVRERYENFLKKKLNRGPFTAAEDALILELIELMGRKFYAIAEKMPGRTAIMIKNRYYNKLKNSKQRPRAQSDDLI